MFLENEVIHLRAVEPEDLELLYSWENDSSLWMYGSGTYSPFSKYAIRQYIAGVQDVYECRQLRLMIEEKQTEQIVGTIDLYDFDIHNSRIAVGVLVDKKHRGKGFACQSVGLVEDYVFDYLHIHQIYVHVAESNDASIRLFEKGGYEKNAVLIDWIRRDDEFENVFLFQKTRPAELPE